MTLLIGLLGLLIAGLGVVGSFRPHVIIAAVQGWQARTRFQVAIGLRVLFGIVLLLGAADSRFPNALYLLGGIAIIATVLLVLLGATRTDRLVQRWFDQPPALIRAWLMSAVLFGGFLAYAGL